MPDLPPRDVPVAARDAQVMHVDCPARRVLRVIGDKWTPVVLYRLAGGTWRFADLQRCIPDISKKMLVQVLRALEADGLVHRTVYPVVPPKTEYALTDNGRRLHEITAMLCHWADENEALLRDIEAHRQS